MKVKRLEEYDKNQLVSSYAIPDIFNLIWILIRYGKTRVKLWLQIAFLIIAIERDAKNIQLKLCVENGSFELLDDGDSLNLIEMAKESILLKCKAAI
jgi:hypothetical protein